jgi:hypothetical protein
MEDMNLDTDPMPMGVELGIKQDPMKKRSKGKGHGAKGVDTSGGGGSAHLATAPNPSSTQVNIDQGLLRVEGPRQDSDSNSRPAKVELGCKPDKESRPQSELTFDEKVEKGLLGKLEKK